jgi:hypothetical protein
MGECPDSFITLDPWKGNHPNRERIEHIISLADACLCMNVGWFMERNRKECTIYSPESPSTTLECLGSFRIGIGSRRHCMSTTKVSMIINDLSFGKKRDNWSATSVIVSHLNSSDSRWNSVLSQWPVRTRRSNHRTVKHKLWKMNLASIKQVIVSSPDVLLHLLSSFQHVFEIYRATGCEEGGACNRRWMQKQPRLFQRSKRWFSLADERCVQTGKLMHESDEQTKCQNSSWRKGLTRSGSWKWGRGNELRENSEKWNARVREMDTNALEICYENHSL